MRLHARTNARSPSTLGKVTKGGPLLIPPPSDRSPTANLHHCTWLSITSTGGDTPPITALPPTSRPALRAGRCWSIASSRRRHESGANYEEKTAVPQRQAHNARYAKPEKPKNCPPKKPRLDITLAIMRHCGTGKITPERGLWRGMKLQISDVVPEEKMVSGAISMIHFFQMFF